MGPNEKGPLRNLERWDTPRTVRQRRPGGCDPYLRRANKCDSEIILFLDVSSFLLFSSLRFSVVLVHLLPLLTLAI